MNNYYAIFVVLAKYNPILSCLIKKYFNMEIDSHFIKTADYKTIQVTGAWGGVLGNGVLNLNLFTERIPIPQRIVLEVDTDGKTVKEKYKEGKTGIVREVQVGILMDYQTTKNIYEFLGNSIKDQEKLFQMNKNIETDGSSSNS